MKLNSLLLCVAGLLVACRHGSTPMDRDASADDASADPDAPALDASIDSPGSNMPASGRCTGLAAGLTCRAPYCAADYTVTDLGTLGAGAVSSARAIDDAGNVTGTFHPVLSDVRVHAFRWSARDGFVDLGTLGGDNSQGLGVSGGRTVGVSDLASGGSHAFLSDDGGLHDLGTLGGAGSIARSINAAGVAVGESQLASGVVRAARYQDGAASDLGTLAGTPTAKSAAFAINASGAIVGRSDTASGRSHAALWVNGSVIDLGTIGTADSVANAVNANGDAAGRAGMPALFTGGTVRALGLPRGSNSGVATGINDAGVIVGSAAIVTPSGISQGPGFAFDGTSIIDLNDAIPFRLDNPHITGANAINNAGQIAAQAGGAGGDRQALILTPHCTPAPPFRAVSFATGTQVDPPDGVAAGDLLLAALRYDADPPVLTPPDGWSLVADKLAGAGTDQAFHALVYVHVATAAEPANYAFAAPAGVQVHIQIAAYPYLSAVDDVTATANIGGAISTLQVTTTRDNDVLIAIFMSAAGGSWDRATGMLGRMTQRSNVDGISLQDELHPTTGPTGDRGSRTTDAALAAIFVALE
jgi:probable HAF family extracellular repeat protein